MDVLMQFGTVSSGFIETRIINIRSNAGMPARVPFGIPALGPLLMGIKIVKNFNIKLKPEKQA